MFEEYVCVLIISYVAVFFFICTYARIVNRVIKLLRIDKTVHALLLRVTRSSHQAVSSRKERGEDVMGIKREPQTANCFINACWLLSLRLEVLDFLNSTQ